MRYIQSFSTSGTEREAIESLELGKPYVAYIEDGQYIDWNTLSPTPPEPIYSAMPLTFEIISGGTIYWKHTGLSTTKRTIQYSKNGGNWTNIIPTSAGTELNVASGDIVRFRGDNADYADHKQLEGEFDNNFSDTTCKFEIKGNIMSLITSTGFTTATTLVKGYTFYGLFSNCTGLVSTERLVLPATTLTKFCYGYMFSGCTSLTTAPELPATTLSDYCYRTMFYGCTNLNYIKCLATNISANSCTYNWVNGVSSTGTFVKNANMSSWATGASGIPDGWTVIDA